MKERKRDCQELQAKSNPLYYHDALKTTKYLQAFHEVKMILNFLDVTAASFAEYKA